MSTVNIPQTLVSNSDEIKAITELVKTHQLANMTLATHILEGQLTPEESAEKRAMFIEKFSNSNYPSETALSWWQYLEFKANIEFLEHKYPAQYKAQEKLYENWKEEAQEVMMNTPLDERVTLTDWIKTFTDEEAQIASENAAIESAE